MENPQVNDNLDDMVDLPSSNDYCTNQAPMKIDKISHCSAIFYLFLICVTLLCVLFTSFLGLSKFSSNRVEFPITNKTRFDFYNTPIELIPEYSFAAFQFALYKDLDSLTTEATLDINFNFTKENGEKLRKITRQSKGTKVHFRQASQLSEFVDVYSTHHIYPGNYYGSLSITGDLSSFQLCSISWDVGNPVIHYYQLSLQFIFLLFSTIITLIIFLTNKKYDPSEISTEFNNFVATLISFVIVGTFSMFTVNNFIWDLFLQLFRLLTIILFKLSFITLITSVRMQRNPKAIDELITQFSYILIIGTEVVVHIIKFFSVFEVNQLTYELHAHKMKQIADIVYVIVLTYQNILSIKSVNEGERFRFVIYIFCIIIYYVSDSLAHFAAVRRNTFQFLIVDEIIMNTAMFCLIVVSLYFHAPQKEISVEEYRDIDSEENNQEQDGTSLLADN